MLKSPVNSLYNYKNTIKPKLFSQDFENICIYGYRTKDKKKTLTPLWKRKEYYLEYAFAFHYYDKIDVDIDDK